MRRCRRFVDDMNDLKHTGPPLLLTEPEGAWREIVTTFPVECVDEQARGWERSLRQRIYQHDVIQDDAVHEPVFTVRRNVRVGDYGIPFMQSRSSEAGGGITTNPY